MKEYILSLIAPCFGKANAISKQEIMRKTKLHERSVRLFIRELRLEGVIIASSSKQRGYFIPVTIDELEEYVNDIESRAREDFRVASFARQKLKQMGIEEDQLTLL